LITPTFIMPQGTGDGETRSALESLLVAARLPHG
jgi:hypothetical protein